jgi:hypothetical protein
MLPLKSKNLIFIKINDGIDVAKMDATLLRHIEEIYLHLIDLKKKSQPSKNNNPHKNG